MSRIWAASAVSQIIKYLIRPALFVYIAVSFNITPSAGTNTAAYAVAYFPYTAANSTPAASVAIILKTISVTTA
ncbi:MAG: hypothetical protein A2Y17_01395 [Clostridiales bacterium GWF2_38_85]|nr:MAG: hypothetical protein A2Y17_01395 [Clostridiales bacterium GWF2_38_85]HBL85175.1 hypothetical protein [Clostridiales bacterium]